MAENQKLATELDAAEAQVEEMKPRARLADRILTAQGDMSVREAAQCLAADHGINIGQNRLFRFLREEKWTDPKGIPLQRHIDAGRLRARPTSYEHPRTGERVIAAPQIRITGRGLGEIHARLTTASQLELIP